MYGFKSPEPEKTSHDGFRKYTKNSATNWDTNNNLAQIKSLPSFLIKHQHSNESFKPNSDIDLLENDRPNQDLQNNIQLNKLNQSFLSDNTFSPLRVFDKVPNFNIQVSAL